MEIKSCCVCLSECEKCLKCDCKEVTCIECILNYKKLSCPSCNIHFKDIDIKPFFEHLEELYIADFISTVFDFGLEINFELLNLENRNKIRYNVMRNIPVKCLKGIKKNFNCKRCKNIVDGNTKKCIECGFLICVDCEEEEHEGDCDPVILEDIDYKRQICKSCPVCFVYIYKTEGCDHMKCLNCGAAFEWSKEKITLDRYDYIFGKDFVPINSTLYKRYQKKYNELSLKTFDNLIENFKNLFDIYVPNNIEKKYLMIENITKYVNDEIKKNEALKLEYLRFLRKEIQKNNHKENIEITINYPKKIELYHNIKKIQYYKSILHNSNKWFAKHEGFSYQFFNENNVIETYVIKNEGAGKTVLKKKNVYEFYKKVETEFIIPDEVKGKWDSDNLCVHFNPKNFYKKIISYNSNSKIPSIKDDEIEYYQYISKLADNGFSIDESKNTELSKEILFRMVKEKEFNILFIYTSDFEKWNDVIEKFTDDKKLSIFLIKNHNTINLHECFCCDYDNEISFGTMISSTKYTVIKDFVNKHPDDKVMFVLDEFDSCRHRSPIKYFLNYFTKAKNNVHCIGGNFTYSPRIYNTHILYEISWLVFDESMPIVKNEILQVTYEDVYKVIEYCQKRFLENISIEKIVEKYKKIVKECYVSEINIDDIMFKTLFEKCGGTSENIYQFLKKGKYENRCETVVGRVPISIDHTLNQLKSEKEHIILLAIFELNRELKSNKIFKKSDDFAYITHGINFIKTVYKENVLKDMFHFIIDKAAYKNATKNKENVIINVYQLVNIFTNNKYLELEYRSREDLLYTEKGVVASNFELDFAPNKENSIITNYILEKITEKILFVLHNSKAKVIISSLVSEVDSYIDWFESEYKFKCARLLKDDEKLYNEFINSSEIRILFVDLTNYNKYKYPLYDSVGGYPRFIFSLITSHNHDIYEFYDTFNSEKSKSKTKISIVSTYNSYKQDLHSFKKSFEKKYNSVCENLENFKTINLDY